MRETVRCSSHSATEHAFPLGCGGAPCPCGGKHTLNQGEVGQARISLGLQKKPHLGPWGLHPSVRTVPVVLCLFRERAAHLGVFDELQWEGTSGNEAAPPRLQGE